MPLTRLSKTNIRRARRIVNREKKYKHFGAQRKNRIVFKVAWNIQKGRIRKSGHR